MCLWSDLRVSSVSLTDPRLHKERIKWLFGAMRLCSVCVCALLLCIGANANRGASHLLTDEIPFKINWPGEHFTLVKTNNENSNAVRTVKMHFKLAKRLTVGRIDLFYLFFFFNPAETHLSLTMCVADVLRRQSLKDKSHFPF